AEARNAATIFILTANGLRDYLRQYAAGAGDLCTAAPADETESDTTLTQRGAGWISDQLSASRPSGNAHMNALTFGRRNPQPDSTDRRGRLLRWLDSYAEWQMRHAYGVINRVQTDKATITSVTQPSSSNERSSTKP